MSDRERFVFVFEPLPPLPGENDAARRVAGLLKVALRVFRLRARWAPVREVSESLGVSQDPPRRSDAGRGLRGVGERQA